MELRKSAQNTLFQIQLSGLTNDVILLPKSTNIGVCDSTLNEKHLYPVESSLDRNQSMSTEDRAAMELTKRAER